MVTAVRNWVVSARTKIGAAGIQWDSPTATSCASFPRALISYPTGYAQLASVTMSAADFGAQVHAFSNAISPDQFWKAC